MIDEYIDEDFSFRMTFSPIFLNSKPQGVIVSKIKKSLNIKNSIEIDFKTLKEFVLKHTFCCADLKTPNTKGWLSQQVFGLDFDSGITPEDVIHRLKEYNLEPNLIYSTFSDSPQLRKFRVLFITDTELIGETESKIAKQITKGLLEIFPEADKSCKDIARMYYPGKEILFESKKINNLQFFENVCLTNYAKNHSRGSYACKTRDDDNLNKKYEDIKKLRCYDYEDARKVKIVDAFFYKDVRVSYNILFGLATNFQKVKGGITKMLNRMNEINEKGGGKYLSNDIKENENRGIEKYPSDYFENIKSIKRYKYFPEMLTNFSPFESDYDYHNLLDVKMKRGDVIVKKEKEWMKLENAEKVFEDSFTLALKKKDFIIKTTEAEKDKGLFAKNKKFISKKVEEVKDEFKYYMDNEYDRDSPIYIFKVATGLGKTKRLEELKNVLIALPTHQLKNEICGRMKIYDYLKISDDIKKQVENGEIEENSNLYAKLNDIEQNGFIATPDIPTFSNDVLNETLEIYRNGGMFTDASSLIKKIANDKVYFEDEFDEKKYKIVVTEDDIIKATEYVRINNIVRDFEGTVITTHSRALNDKSFKHKTIIFDEDPLDYKIQINSMQQDFGDFMGGKYQNFVMNSLMHCLNTTMNRFAIEKTPSFNVPKGFKQNCIKYKRTDIINFLESDLTYIEYDDKNDKNNIHFCKKVDFGIDKNVIILSATAPVFIYEKLYKNRVRNVDIEMIDQVGIVEQYTKRSFSKSSMLGKRSYSAKVWKEIFNIINNQPVITHLGVKRNKNNINSKIENGELNFHNKFHFGNCSGSDDLNGRDIAVIGTPNRPTFVYMFYAKLMDLTREEMGDVSEMENRIITYKGLEFPFFTFKTDYMQKIQLGLIESDIIQAVGRNRTLRTDAKTKLFSALPISLATNYMDSKK